MQEVFQAGVQCQWFQLLSYQSKISAAVIHDAQPPTATLRQTLDLTRIAITEHHVYRAPRGVGRAEGQARSAGYQGLRPLRDRCLDAFKMNRRHLPACCQ